MCNISYYFLTYYCYKFWLEVVDSIMYIIDHKRKDLLADTLDTQFILKWAQLIIIASKPPFLSATLNTISRPKGLKANKEKTVMPNLSWKAFDINGHSIWAIKEIVLSKRLTILWHRAIIVLSMKIKVEDSISSLCVINIVKTDNRPVVIIQ